MIRRNKKEEEEEARLREELKNIDAQIKKFAKKDKPVGRPAGGGGGGGGAGAGGAGGVPPPMTAAQLINLAITAGTNSMSMYEQPKPGKPLLQSSRLVPPAESNTQLSKSFMKKLTWLLKEIGLPEKPLATRAVCDLFDEIKKDAVVLVSLQTAVSKKGKKVDILQTRLKKSSTHA